MVASVTRFGWINVVNKFITKDPVTPTGQVFFFLFRFQGDMNQTVTLKMTRADKINTPDGKKVLF